MFARLILLFVFTLLSASPALAIDPECEIDPRLTEWACFESTCRFCTPAVLTTDAVGVSCTVIVDGSVIASVSNAIAGRLVTVNHSLEGSFPFKIRCDDNLDTSETTGPGRFSQSSQPLPTVLAPPFLLP